METLIIVFSGIANVVLLFLIIKKHFSNSSTSTENELIKEILDLGMLKDFDKSNIIVDALTKYYKIDYCTVLINKHELKCIATNNNQRYIGNIETKCNKILKELNGAAKFSYSPNYFNYESSISRKVKYFYFIPLKSDGELLGAIFIENREDYKENDFEVDFFKIVIKNITLVLQNCLYQEEMINLAMRDNLTGIFNRNYMNKHIESLVNSYKNVVVGIMDIDHFKRVNDTYGHDFGDLVLVSVSKRINELLEDRGQLYRWGGEEFIISVVDSNIVEVEVFINYIREEISKLAISNDKYSINITASFGLATFNESISNTIKRADKALYYSKENGRNKVTVYDLNKIN